MAALTSARRPTWQRWLRALLFGVAVLLGCVLAFGLGTFVPTPAAYAFGVAAGMCLGVVAALSLRPGGIEALAALLWSPVYGLLSLSSTHLVKCEPCPLGVACGPCPRVIGHLLALSVALAALALAATAALRVARAKG